MCLNETYDRIRVDKHLSGVFPIKNGLKKGDAFSPLLFSFTLEYAIMRVQVKYTHKILYVYTFVGKGKKPSGTSLIEYSLETSRRLREVMTPSRLVFLDKLISPLYKNNEN
jgi:hypothetical protein